MSIMLFNACGRTLVLRGLKLSLGLAAVIAGAGCSADIQRLSSAKFDSGYSGTQNDLNGTPAKTASLPGDNAQSAGNNAGSGRVQLASANGAGPSGGYLQAAKIDLPPVEDRSGPTGVRTADGYGLYNKRPLHDGAYEGPRVTTPYERHGRKDHPYERHGGKDHIVNPPDEDLIIEDGPGVKNPRLYKPSHYPQRPSRPDYPSHNDGDAHNDGEAHHPDKMPGKVIKVEPGDTLYAIAIRYGTTVHAIIEANDLPDTHIKVGEKLIIPAYHPQPHKAHGPAHREHPRERHDHEEARGYDPAQGPVAYAATVKNEPDKKGRSPQCTETGACHVVEAGDSLGSIASRHNVAAIAILEANGLNNPRQIKPGHVLAIPGKDHSRAEQEAAPAGEENPPAAGKQSAAREDKHVQDGAHETPPEKSGLHESDVSKAPAPEADAERYAALPSEQAPAVAEPSAAEPAEKTCEAALVNPLPRSGRTFREPVEGLVVAKFGPQTDGTVSEGIKISVPKGTPVKAAENGVVAYAGNELSGFGNLILIRHADDYVTAYAHNDELIVKRCDVVKRGEVIAKAGATGDVSQPQLHFEIRRASKPVDPVTLF